VLFCNFSIKSKLMMEHVTTATLHLQFVVERKYTCSSEKRAGERENEIDK
jgi:hypothetical protein